MTIMQNIQNKIKAQQQEKKNPILKKGKRPHFSMKTHRWQRYI